MGHGWGHAASCCLVSHTVLSQHCIRGIAARQHLASCPVLITNCTQQLYLQTPHDQHVLKTQVPAMWRAPLPM